MEKSGLSQILGRLPLSILAQFPHQNFPCPNLHMQDILDADKESDESEPCREVIEQTVRYFKPFPYVGSLPVPILEPAKALKSAMNGLDPAVSMIRSKMKWDKKKALILAANISDKKHILKSTAKNIKKLKQNIVLTLNRGVAMMASHLAADPDPSFSGTYNWYYSGGTLATLSSGDNTFLLSSTGQIDDTLRLTLLSKDKDGLRAQKTHTITVKNESSQPVYQVLATEGYVAVRQKKKVTVLVPEESDHEIKLSLKEVHSAGIDKNKEAVFVGATVSPSSDLQYCTLTTSGLLRLWQPGTKDKCVSEVKVDIRKEFDNWGSVQYHDENTVLLLNRSHIYVLDLRSMETVQSWCQADLGKLCELCEDLSMCVASSRQQHLKYVGTNHQAFALDIREGFTQRWTHLMSIPPYIGCTTPVNTESELLFLGNQSSHQVVAIVNNCHEEYAESNSLPLTLPTPLEGLHSAQMRATCFSPYTETRCKMSLTGLCCLPGPNGPLLLRQSSLGDVFCQQLQDRNYNFRTTLSDCDLELFTNWGDQCVTAVKDLDSVCITNILNLKSLLEANNNEKTVAKEWSEVHSNIPKNNVKYHPVVRKWQLSKQFLEGCVDVLAPKLLSVWDIEDEEEWAEEEDEEGEEQDPDDKVRNWLDSTPLKFEPGVEPLSEDGESSVEAEIHEKGETYNTNWETLQKKLTAKTHVRSEGIREIEHIKRQGVLRLRIDDDVSIRAVGSSEKRRLSTSPVASGDDKISPQLTCVQKKRKLYTAPSSDIFDKGSENSQTLPRRKFLNVRSPGLNSPKPEVSTKLCYQDDAQSDQSYPLTQKVHDSQMFVRKQLPRPDTPCFLRNMSPIRFDSEVDSMSNASFTLKSQQKFQDLSAVKLPQPSSQHDMFAGTSPQRSEPGPDLPVTTPHSSQKPAIKDQKTQSVKKKFVMGF